MPAAKQSNLSSQLRKAISKNDATGIAALAKKGADANAPVLVASGYGAPLAPLLTAILTKKRKAVEALVAAGANVNVIFSGDGERGITALMLAASHQDASMVKALLAGGADPKVMTRHGRTAINFAVERDRDKCLPVLKLLMDAGCPAGAGALGWPMTDGDPEVIRLLIEAGADVNQPSTTHDGDRSGWAPIARAVLQHGLAEAMRKAMKQMGRAAQTDQDKARWLAVIKLLLAAGADPDKPSNLGSARETATRNNNAEILSLFPRAKSLKPAEKSSPAKRKVKLPKPTKAGKAGVRDFLEFLYDCHPEWAVLLVEAPIDSTIKALQKLRKFRHWEQNVALQPFTEEGSGGTGIDETPVVKLLSSAWTIIFRLLGRPLEGEMREVSEDAAALSKAMNVRAATFIGEDTSGAFGYELFDRGKRAKGKNWEADDESFASADAVFKELGVYLPVCIAHENADGETAVAAPAKDLPIIARADVISL